MAVYIDLGSSASSVSPAIFSMSFDSTVYSSYPRYPPVSTTPSIPRYPAVATPLTPCIPGCLLLAPTPGIPWCLLLLPQVSHGVYSVYSFSQRGWNNMRYICNRYKNNFYLQVASQKKLIIFRSYNIMASQIECNTIYRAPQEPFLLIIILRVPQIKLIDCNARKMPLSRCVPLPGCLENFNF